MMTFPANIVSGKRLTGTALLTVFCLLFTPFAVPTHAAFEDKGTGARQTAMGDTFVSAGQDVHSLMVNPAGLAGLRQKMVTSEYSKLYAGLSDGSSLAQYFMGYGQPVKWGGTLALGWKQFSLDDLYTERTMSLGYGEWITDRVAAGLAFKQLYHSFGEPNIIVDNSGQVQAGRPQFFAQNGNSNTAYSTDLGVLIRMSRRDLVGLSILDINEPNIALAADDRDKVARTIRVGMTHDASRGLTLSGSLMSREALDNQRDTTLTGAVEKWWKLRDEQSVAARGSLATGSREFRQMGTGASYKMQSFQIDYAFVFNIAGVGIGDTAGTHRFSFSYRWGAVVPERHLLSKGEQPEVELGVGDLTPRQASVPPPDVVAEELSIMLTQDSDSDGVVDDFEMCPDTPYGVVVDQHGCPLDTDKDGVPDYRDQCPSTPKGTVVDRTGCALPTTIEIEFLPLEPNDLPTSVELQITPTQEGGSSK